MMMSPARRILTALFLTLPFAGAEIDFAHQVVPILRENCAECHSGEASKGGFSINTRDDLLENAEPGNPDQSYLLELILSGDEEERMPPEDHGDRLPDGQVAILRQWIAEGVLWEPGFTFGESAYETPLAPRRPDLPPVTAGREHPIDRIIDRYFQDHSVSRPEPLGDAAFIRRLSLDLIGLLPTPEEVTGFVNDPDPEKRRKWIDRTLARDSDYAEHWLTLWNDLLRNDYQGTGYIDGGRRQISQWLYDSLVSNKPYDGFAEELIAPPGEDSRGFIDGIQWRGAVNASQTREVQFSQSITQTFLGLNMKCASCHDSFVDRWKLDEAYSLAAIYAEKPLEIARCDVPTGKFAKPAWIFPELGTVDPAAPQPERLRQLAKLMTHPENGRFTRTLVNRLWHRLMGRGIVHPVDSMDSPPWSEDLLDHLAVRFADNGYDLRKALAYIASSEIYQSQAISGNEPGPDAPFRGPLAKRLTAEQFVDAVWTLTGTAPDQPHKAIRRNVSATSSGLTADWIWSYAEASSAAPAGEAIALGTDFTLPAAPTRARAVFIIDNEGSVIVNGRPVASTDGDPAPNSIEIDSLKQGRNTLVVAARNGGQSPNPAGVIFELHIEFPDSDPLVVASGPHWKWSATLPNDAGRFEQTPRDWRPAATLANPAVWSRFSAGLEPGLDPENLPMVRASLVPADLLMRALGRPNREQIVSMRPDNITTLEAIDLANGEVLADLLHQGAERLSGSSRATGRLIDQIFLHALSRPPTPGEKSALADALGPRPDAQAIEDLLWLVLLLPEFQFVR